MFRSVLNLMTITLFLLLLFQASTVYASNNLSQTVESEFNLEFRERDILIGTLWIKAKFQFDGNNVEIIKFDKGYTKTTSDPQFIFSHHESNFRFGPDMRYVRVNTFLDVEARGEIGIEVTTEDIRRTTREIRERRALLSRSSRDGSSLIFEKKRVQLFLECNQKGSTATGWGY